VFPLRAATYVSVSQLEAFLRSRKTSKESDAEISDQLTKAQLSEQLTAQTFTRIEKNARLGPKTIEQLKLMAYESMFRVPPANELPPSAPPSETDQRQMVEEAKQYADTVFQGLPNFLANRITQSFDNVPQQSGSMKSGPNHAKPEAKMHFLGEFHREIGFRDSREISESTTGESLNRDSSSSSQPGLTTWGEFGPILKAILKDSIEGNVTWNRWQLSETGVLVAVFRYKVPRSASNYAIDFCCYRKSQNDPEEGPFRDNPGYHGEFYLNPKTGTVDRITVEAELADSDPVFASSIAVQYGNVDIGGKSYIAPVHAVAVSQVHNPKMEVVDRVGPEVHVNEVFFQNYHKFGSTFRILTDSQIRNRPEN
jgi:hypothetical protein